MQFRITIGILIITLVSCKESTIKVQNNISQVKITDVKWGETYIAWELLPGESSDKINIHGYDADLPESNIVGFTMQANNKVIYLETEGEYLLNEDEDLLIVLTDSTKVRNPNE